MGALPWAGQGLACFQRSARRRERAWPVPGGLARVSPSCWARGAQAGGGGQQIFLTPGSTRVEEVQRRTAVPGPPGRAHLPVEEPSGPSAALCLRLAHLPRPWSPGASAGSTQQSAASVFVCTT